MADGTKQEEKKEQKQEEETFGKDYVHGLREENKAQRIARLETEQKLNDLLAANKKAEEEKLKEQGKFKEVADAREKENLTLKEQNKNILVNAELKIQALKLGMTDLDGLKMLSPDDLAKIVVDADSVKGAEDIIKGLKEKKPYLFAEEKVIGVNKGRAGGDGGQKPKYTLAQYRDNTFYTANKADMDLAQREGRIVAE